MKYILYLCLILAMTKSDEINICDAPNAVRCLRDYIQGESAGGVWTQVSGPMGVDSLLVGQNPCFEWSGLACGVYQFKYKVVTVCCRDSVILKMRKCCATVSLTCE